MKQQNSMRTNDRLVFIAFLAPSLFAFSMVVLIPFIMGLYYSFTNWNGAIQAQIDFVGLENFRQIFRDPTFINAFIVTTIYTIASVLIVNTLALMLALMVTGSLRYKNFYRSGFFTPNLIGGIVLGYIWQFVFNHALPGLGQLLGFSGLANLLMLSRPNLAILAIVTVNAWQYAGYIMMIYVAAIQSVPVSLLEAAQIDGAPFFARVKAILLPLVAPAFTVSSFLTLVNSFKQFDVNVALTNGGPSTIFMNRAIQSSEFLALNIYNTAFSMNKMAQGQAKAVVFFVVLVAVSLVQVYFNKRKELEM
jgi:raffinose/stachyose/melibiose transport system permease protein